MRGPMASSNQATWPDIYVASVLVHWLVSQRKHTLSHCRTMSWYFSRGRRDLQRLKAQGLWWRVEGEASLAEECVDEVGLSLDGAEPAADQGLKLAEGGCGVVAQACFHD